MDHSILKPTEHVLTLRSIAEDVKTADGTDAYRWDSCVELADDKTTRASAVKNAGTSKGGIYFVIQ